MLCLASAPSDVCCDQMLAHADRLDADVVVTTDNDEETAGGFVLSFLCCV